MTTEIDQLSVAITADTSGFRRELIDIDRISKRFGASLGDVFVNAAIKGKSFGEVLSTLALKLSSAAVSAAFKPIETGLSSLFSGLFKGILPFAAGGVVAGGRVRPFASGGVVAQPTYFPMAQGLTGLMGERGAEAILPLARGADGKLGVSVQNNERPVSVTVNIATPDVEGFRRSEQLVAASLARAVGRGRRSL